MAYNDKSPDFIAFTAFVEPWLKSQVHQVNFAQLHYALDSLQYLLASDRSGIDIPAPRELSHVFCSEHGCDTTSHTPGACLINFAARGAEPIWRCRRHHLETAGYPPPGWTPPDTEQVKAATMVAWNKLTPAERPLINRNIVSQGTKEEG